MMKKKVFSGLFVICLGFSLCTAAGRDSTCEKITFRMENMKLLRNLGIVATGAGTAFTAIGIVMMAQADWQTHYYYSSDGEESGDPLGGFGSVLAAGGIQALAGGALLWFFCGHDLKKQRELFDSTCAVRLRPHNGGLCVALSWHAP